MALFRWQKYAVSSAVDDDDDDDDDRCYDSESFIGLYSNVNSDSPEGVSTSGLQVSSVQYYKHITVIIYGHITAANVSQYYEAFFQPCGTLSAPSSGVITLVRFMPTLVPYGHNKVYNIDYCSH